MSNYLILDSLSQIILPEFKQNILDLGWIKLIKKKTRLIFVKIILPTFAISSLQYFKNLIQKAIKSTLKDASITVSVYILSNVKILIPNSNTSTGIHKVKNIILVVSGKGGVGKSTVASNLSLALLNKGCKVGLLDADIYGPSIPTMFNLTSKINIFAHQNSNADVLIEPIIRNGLKMISIGFLVEQAAAMIWRGPVISSACLQLFHNVLWGDLDYLIVDMPPGTGDIHLTIAQKIPITGALLISTPHNLAIADVVRIKSLLKKMNTNILGYVENMSCFTCPKCQCKNYIFDKSDKKHSLLNITKIMDLPICHDLNYSHPAFQYLATFIGITISKLKTSSQSQVSDSINVIS